MYRRITFPNGLEALLISDPSLVRSRSGGGGCAPLSRSSLTDIAGSRLGPTSFGEYLTRFLLPTRAGWHADPRRGRGRRR